MDLTGSFKKANLNKLVNMVAWGVWILCFIAYIWSLAAFQPKVTTITRSYPLPYVPANLDDSRITNIFSEWRSFSGGPAIGMAQADSGSIEDYMEKVSEVEGTSYLSVTPGFTETMVDYYFEKPGSMIIRHYGYTIPFEVYQKWLVSGRYVTKEYHLDGSEITITGVYNDDEGLAMAVTAFFLLLSVLYALLIETIKHRYFRRNRSDDD